MPRYEYFLDGLRKHTEGTRLQLQESGVRLKYALKANRNNRIIQTLAEAGVEGWDTSSAGELQVVRDKKNVTISGPAKSMEDLESAVRLGAVVEVESLQELRRLSEVDRARYAIRIRPPFRVGGASVDMCSSWFGVGVDEVEDITAFGDAAGMQLKGFHCFPGSQNLDTDELCKYFEEIGKVLSGLSKQVGLHYPYLNVGGGVGVPYYNGQSPVDFTRITKTLSEVTRSFEADWWVELGRYLVAEYGEYVVKVVNKKKVDGKTFLITDGGMHHHSAASGNLGGVIPRNYPIETTSKSDEVETVTIVGCLCTTIDTLARDVTIPVTEVGDEVRIKMSGAYGLSASPTSFLSHPLAQERFV